MNMANKIGCEFGKGLSLEVIFRLILWREKEYLIRIRRKCNKGRVVAHAVFYVVFGP